MKKVLFLCSEYQGHGGIQRFNRNLLQALVLNHSYIDILSLNDSAHIKEREYILFGMKKNKIKLVLALFKCLIFKQYDVIICGHINFSPMLQFILKCIFFRKHNAILILHGIDVWDRVKGLKRFFSKYFNKVLSVSRYTEDSFVSQMLSIKNITFHVFPNTISPDWSLPSTKPEKVLPVELIKSKSTINLLSVSRLDTSEREKGIVDVLDALYILKKSGFESFTYNIVGSGNDRDNLINLSKKLLIDDNVNFMGSVTDEELFLQYKKADIFILPSSKEGFGIVFLEAMLFGLPVIGASEKGALDVIDHGINGYLVPYGDSKEICKTIKSYFDSPSDFKNLGENGYQMVVGDGVFSFDSFVSRVNRLILR